MKKTANPVNFEAKDLTRPSIGDVLPQYLLAFIFPTLTVITAFAILGCYPFGNKTMLTVDLYHQYAPYLVQFRNKVLSGDSLFYSWNDGLGNEYFAAYANYTASPLNIFSLFFTAKTMPVFIAFITAVRAGLASLAMTFFLKENDGGRLDNITVAFAACYALCGWFVTDFWNIMWCDAMILLPIICLGLRRLFVKNSWWLYMVSLGVAIADNYFTGYFLCIFLVLFAPVYCIVLQKKFSILHTVKCAAKFAVSSLIAGAATAAITLPTYLILQHCSATGGEFPKDYNLTGTLFDFIGRFLVAANPSIRDGMANVHCGLIVVIMVPLFFLLPKESGIGLRHKFGFGILLGILYLSFTNRTLNYIWHGMHFPNQIPYRQSFLMPFILVLMGFLTIRRLRQLPRNALGASIAGSVIFLILYEKFGEGDEGYIQIGMTLLFIIVQGVALKVIADKKRSMVFCEMLLTTTIFVECLAGSIVSIALVAKNEGFVGYNFYGKNYKEIYSYVSEAEGTEGHKTFERSELFPNNICNIQSIYNIKGLSIFSSTVRESFVKYNRNFGFHNNNINGFRNAGITWLTGSLYGVRNLIAIENTNTVPKIFEEDYKDDKITVYGNPDALAVGFMVDPAIVDYEPDWNYSNVFDKTNKWLNSMGVQGDAYTPVEMEVMGSDKMTTSSSQGSILGYTVTPGSTDPNFTVSVNEADMGADIYLYVNATSGGSVSVRTEEGDYTYEIRSYQTICLGKFTGSPITATVKYSANPGTSLTVYAYELTQNDFYNAISYLNDEELEVTDYSSTDLKGTVTALNDGLLFLSIPYSEGWTAYVDGKEQEITPIGDAFIGLELDAGKHDIELKYSPEGFGTGLLISIGSLAVMAGLSVLFELLNRKGAAKDETVDQEDQKD
ncbi:MAG: YfhO family protein [Clostridiales bacterium]|nr:YfhO family protein [Clostridiales bacterium]